MLASSYIGQLKAKASQMMRESDFHQVPNDKTTAVIMKQEEKKAAPVEPKPEPVKKEVVTIKEPVAVAPKAEKKLQRQAIKAPSPQPPVIDLVDSRENVALEKSKRERSPSPVAVREASVASTRSADRVGRDTKRSERREKERDDDRKRDKERRRNKRDASPPHESYYKAEPEAVYPPEVRVRDRERATERERDLSSVSNSSHGSPVRARSMEPPAEPIERESKRRKIEAPKKSSNEKRDKTKTPKKDKQVDETKEQRREKRKKDRSDEVTGGEKRSRKDDEKQHKNGDDPSPRVSKHHHVRENSPMYDESREKSYKSSRSRGGY